MKFQEILLIFYNCSSYLFRMSVSALVVAVNFSKRTNQKDVSERTPNMCSVAPSLSAFLLSQMCSFMTFKYNIICSSSGFLDDVRYSDTAFLGFLLSYRAIRIYKESSNHDLCLVQKSIS